MRSTSFLSLFLLGVMACSEDDAAPDNNKPPEVTSCLLMSVTTSIGTNTFVRNDEGVVTAINYKAGAFTGGCTIEYDGSGKVVRINDSQYYTLYFYDGEGRVSEEKAINENPSPLEVAESTRTFQYNASGQLEKINYSTGAYTRYEYDAAGNVQKVYAYRGSGLGPEFLQREYLDFDDKAFIMKTVPFAVNATLGATSVLNIRTSLSFEQMVNNYRKVNYHGSDGSFSTQTLGFVYNEAGYPTGITGGQQVTFSYTCQ